MDVGVGRSGARPARTRLNMDAQGSDEGDLFFRLMFRTGSGLSKPASSRRHEPNKRNIIHIPEGRFGTFSTGFIVNTRTITMEYRLSPTQGAHTAPHRLALLGATCRAHKAGEAARCSRSASSTRPLLRSSAP